MKKIFLFIITLCLYEIYAGNKILYVISPPRSLSTSLLRSIEARKDFVIINEPSWYAYNAAFFGVDKSKHLFREGSPRTYAEVKRMVFENAKHSSVFIKEISFAVEPFLLEDEELMRNPDVYFVFLLRNPHAAILSFYKKRFKEIPLQKFGYRASYVLFEKIKQCGFNKPLIILAEELSRHPEEILSWFCQKVGIDFKPESLHWPDLGDNFTGEEWHEIKYPQRLYHWHDTAIHSTGFKPLTTYAIDAHGRPTFAEVAVEDLNEVVSLYNLMMPYYQRMLAEKDFMCGIPFKGGPPLF